MTINRKTSGLSRDTGYGRAESVQERLLHMLAGKWVATVVQAAARLGVADHLIEGPMRVDELAEATRTHGPTLYRFLRAAASVGVFAERPDGRFELTPLAGYLRSDVPGSLRDLAHFYGETTAWNVYGHVMHTLRTGEPVGPGLRGGKTWFEYLEQDEPEFAEPFHRAMTALNEERAPRIAESFDFGRFSVIADIGGGEGRLLGAILERHPGTRGILYDIPSAIKGAEGVLDARGVEDRVECVEGNFFEEVPPGADAYVLKAIMHDWGDSECLSVLCKIRSALDGREDGRVLVVDNVVPELNEWHYSKLMDIGMLVNDGGKERDENEWKELLAEAGFKIRAVHDTVPPQKIIECMPV